MNYLYDGSFDGFLSCVWHHYYTENADRIFAETQQPDAETTGANFMTKTQVRTQTLSSTQNSATPTSADSEIIAGAHFAAQAPPHAQTYSARNNAVAWQPDFICEERRVKSESEKADVVANAIARKLSPYDLERVYRVFRTNAEDKEMKLLRYIILGFRQGAKIRLMHGDPVVFTVQKEEARIGTEVHRLCGLIRFSVVRTGYFTGTMGEDAHVIAGEYSEDAASAGKIDMAGVASAGKIDTAGVTKTELALRENPDLLYAPIEPDNDVLEFLAPHFCARFHADPFIIHDVKRGKALAAYRKEWYVADFSEDAALALTNTETEENYRALWRRYFDTIAIKERTNPACQRRFMPARYWKNLTEIR